MPRSAHQPAALSLERDGAECFQAAAMNALASLGELFAQHPPAAAGTRLFDNAGLHELVAADRPLADLAAQLLGSRARPVRAILFDKSDTANWALGWHQDRVIAVRSRVDHPDYGPWSIKRGIHHVAPPWPLLSAMRTFRIHLDRVPIDNAPLLVAPGSHRLGIIAEPDIAPLIARLGTRPCLADAGDVWAYATPILHASAPSAGAAHRRVLQLDYAANDLPDGLEWYGI